MAKKSDFDLVRISTQSRALQRLAQTAPGTYEKVSALRQAHGILYKLTADNFDKVFRVALHGLLVEGEVKRPLTTKEAEMRHLLAY